PLPVRWPDGLFAVHQQTSAASAIQVQGLITTQTKQDLRFLLQRTARGNARRPSLDDQHDQMPVACITHSGSGGIFAVAPAVGEQLFFAIGDMDPAVMDKDGTPAD